MLQPATSVRSGARSDARAGRSDMSRQEAALPKANTADADVQAEAVRFHSGNAPPKVSHIWRSINPDGSAGIGRRAGPKSGSVQASAMHGHGIHPPRTWSSTWK